MSVQTTTNTHQPSTSPSLQKTTNTHQPSHLKKRGWMKDWWVLVVVYTDKYQPSTPLFYRQPPTPNNPLHPFLTENHQHPVALYSIPFYREPPTPTNPLILLKGMDEGLVGVGGCLYRQPPTPTNPSSIPFKKMRGLVGVGGCL